MILSLLVGSLLVGRQIVDRAKIQRIIFEFDYYEKAFHQFYDTYRVVPGNLDYKTCIKHAEFSGCYNSGGSVMGTNICSGQYNVNDWCSHHTFAGVSGKHILKNSCTAFWWWAIQMKKAGYLTEDNYPFLPHNGGSGSCYKLWKLDLTNSQSVGGADNRTNAGHYPLVSFDRSISIGMIGMNDNYTVGAGWEYYAKKLMHHNAIIFQNINIVDVVNAQGKKTGSKYVDLKYGALNAKLSSELDAKIDDGRPGTGTLIVYKSNYQQDVAGDENKLKQICYDSTIDNIEHAIYNTSTDMKYGCNLVKIMEDVK